ncbi:DNA gyrase inhibitor YacG [Microbaculum marinum]|uniref:DNA gyrase inhibitor YacG n=1 Tax=Microbaculum marinum TaxID=1764581 RepID=A0AAW9RXA6_9HYPH
MNDHDPGGKAAPRAGERCPICGQPTVHRNRPFCSSRCANIDLNRWLTGHYAIPVVEDEDEDGGPRDSEGPDGAA